MRIRIVWVLAALSAVCAIATVIFLINPSVLRSGDLSLETEDFVEGDAILIKTEAARLGVQKGDAFPYAVMVWYDPDLVSEVDRDSIDRGLNLAPFEIREVRETDSALDSGLRLYRREYDIQLIGGDVNTLYGFPSLVVRYKPVGSEGLYEKTILPEPIFVAARLPLDGEELELRPLKGEIEDASRKYLPWILWALGGSLAVLGAANLAWRTIPQWKAATQERKEVESGDVLVQAYGSLCRNVANDADSGRLLHQMDRILRIVLARKEGADWLEEPDLDSVAPDIRPAVVSLFQRLGDDHAALAELHDVNEALRLLKGILHFYFGGAEVELWSR